MNNRVLSKVATASQDKQLNCKQISGSGLNSLLHFHLADYVNATMTTMTTTIRRANKVHFDAFVQHLAILLDIEVNFFYFCKKPWFQK